MKQKFTAKTLKKFLSGEIQKSKNSPIKYKKDKVYMCFDSFKIKIKADIIYIDYFYKNELLYQCQDIFYGDCGYIVNGLKIKMEVKISNM